MKKKRRILIIAAVFLVLIHGSGYYLYNLIHYAGDAWPAEDAEGSLTSEIDSLKRNIQMLRLETSQLDKYKLELSELTKSYELAEKVLPKDTTPDQLLAAIRLKVKQSGVVLIGLNPGRGVGKGNFEEWQFSLNIMGSYDQIATLVNIMEEFETSSSKEVGSEKRFFKITSINISAEDGGLAGLGSNAIFSSKKGHTCSLTLVTYRYLGK